MIKVRLYTEEEYGRALGIDSNGRHDRVLDYEGSFDSILYNLNNRYACPFRDAESVRFLKEVEDVTFISDDDWYTVMWDNQRTCISEIHKEWKFGLMAIDHSRDGTYTWYFPAGKKVWGILADMPFDILIAVRMMKVGTHWSGISGTDYQIINYPYEGKTIEVTVKDEHMFHNDDFYTKLSKNHKLRLGKDGRYYLDDFGVRYSLQYFWKNDIEGIIEYISKKDNNRLRLVEINQEYNVFEFAKALGRDENDLVELEYLHVLNCYDCCWEEGDRGDDYKEAVKELQSRDEYQEYLYFRDTFKVISHIVIAPGNTTFRKLPVLMVDKNFDGSYWIHGGLTCKFPNFDGAIYGAIEKRNRNGEQYVLVIDTEELLGSVKDIDCAVYGFKTTPDSIEVFDVEDAVPLFGQMLKEAIESGNCKVDNEFY